MSIIKTKGLVLREANSGEADKIITVLTKEKGKKVIAAKGARSSKSQFVAGTQQFCYCDFIIYENNKSISNLNQLEIIESFHNIRKDLYKLSYATYFMELVENTAMEELACEDLLKLTLKSLQILNKTEYNLKLLARIYELRLMKIIGYMPETTQCVSCGRPLDSFYFNSEVGGVLCNSCKSKFSKSIQISKSTLYTLQYIIAADLSKLFNFSVSDQIISELTQISKSYISVHIEHKFKTLSFLEQL